MGIRIILSGIGGALVGALAALFAVFGPAEIGGIDLAPWHTNQHIGSADAPPLVRAIVARRGLMALRQTETIYFSADHDDEGRALDEACAYRISFEHEPQARWWSVTLYAEDEFLAVNGLEAHSITADHAAVSAEDPVAAIISNVPLAGSPSYWISSRNAGAFNLTLRLYHPDPEVLEDARSAHLPSIERLTCEGET